MIYDRYYYSLLSPAEKRVYQAIYQGIEAFQTDIPVDKQLCAKDRLQTIFTYVGNDNPHIFYVDFSKICWNESLFSLTVKPVYFYSKGETNTLRVKVEAILQKMLSRISGNTEYEKELSVHDLLVSHVVYEESAVDNLQSVSYRTNSILGVLFYKSAVCEGIAKITKYLLNALDIKCIVAYGESLRDGNIGHAWNIVKIGGNAYHVDLTWDICGSQNGVISHDYFNLSDARILKDHSFTERYPACVSEQYDYFVYNGLTVHTASEAQRVAERAIHNGDSFLSFRYIDGVDSFGSVINQATHCVAKATSPNVRYSRNDSQKVCSILIHPVPKSQEPKTAPALPPNYPPFRDYPNTPAPKNRMTVWQMIVELWHKLFW